MKKILVAAVAVSILVPVAAFGAESTGIVKTWDAGSREILLENDAACRFTAGARIPSDLAVGKNVTISYMVFGDENLCRSVLVDPARRRQ